MPLGIAHTETHLYHATKPPVVVYTEADKQAAINAGYTVEYVLQEYPKHVVVERDEKGFPTKTVVAANAEDEKRILAEVK